MINVTGLTSQPKQAFFLTLNDGSLVSCYIEYRPQQLGWFANFSWATWIVSGIRLSAAPNILRQWQNRIPFGLSLLTANNAEPLNLEDFSSGYAQLVLLNSDEVAEVDALAYSGN
jgi:hypothetical protein